MPEKKLVKQNVVYPELSYKIVGTLFSVFNEIGSGHHEKYYQRVMAKALADSKIDFVEQISFPMEFRGTSIGRYTLDFLIDNKVVLEIKKGNRFSKRHIDQVLEYLQRTGIRLGILANFSQEGVNFKRIINFQNS